MQKLKILDRKTPLCFYNDSLLLSDNNKLFSINLHSLEVKFLSSISGNYLYRFLGKNRYLHRLLRLGIHSAVFMQGKIYIVYAKKIYSFDVTNHTFAVEQTLKRGKGPLTMAVVDQPFGNFKAGIYFGEYFGNPNKEKVDVYFKSIIGSDWVNIFSFPKGSINHIHSIVPDLFRKKIWILTGDFGDAAGMWNADMDFQNVMPSAIGKQIYRACVAFPTQQGIIYATDSQLEKNYICLLYETKGRWESKILHSINGSCIYGCKVGKYFVFSTSTEPDMVKKSTLQALFDRNPGPGILKNESHLLLLDEIMNLTILDTKKKDWLPYILFQFGTIKFPGGDNKSNYLFSYTVANVGNDLSSEIWDLS